MTVNGNTTMNKKIDYKLLAVAYGGGLNSTAMIIELINRGYRPNVITFADTGGEKPETYSYIEGFDNWLSNNGGPNIVRVKFEGKHDSLESECLTQNTLPSLAFGYKKCSLKYKVGPQEKYMNNLSIAKEVWNSGSKILKAIGYDAGEAHRLHIYEDEKYIYWYPLVDWSINRDGCIEIIKSAGIPLPPKSACFFCPATRPREIIKLKNCHSDLLERALKIERNALLNADPPIVQIKGLGRSYSWESVIQADESQINLFDDVVNIPCDCFDGWSEYEWSGNEQEDI